MRLDPNTSASSITTYLRAQAERAYGNERADEISSQIEHLSEMLSEIARRELDLTDSPPDTRGIPERGER